jgi:hypothetical protein
VFLVHGLHPFLNNLFLRSLNEMNPQDLPKSLTSPIPLGKQLASTFAEVIALTASSIAFSEIKDLIFSQLYWKSYFNLINKK